MKKRNRCFASSIAFFMLAGLLPTNVQADLKDNSNMLTAVEIEGSSLLDELEGNLNEVKEQALYGDDEFVTAIVELEEAPVMDYYDSSSYFSLDEENSAGESVSKFLASDYIKEVSEELLDNQKNIISEITTLVNENANEGVNVASISEETVEVINLSLGSDNGFADDDSMQKELYKRVNNAGIVLMTAAGNSEKSSDNNNYGGNSLTSNPDESMMSSPAIYESNLSVASIDNTIAVQPYLSWKDEDGVEHNVYYNNPSSGALKANFDGNEEYPIYAVGGVGTYDDYAKVGFNNEYNNGKTGFALVKRGEISFADKINNALSFSGVNSQNEPYGVLGVIVYDNDPNGTSLITMSTDGAAMSSAFISGKDGATIVEALEKGYEVKVSVK